MKKTINILGYTLNWSIILQLITLIVLHLLPYWQDVSIQHFLWFPHLHEALDLWFDTLIPNYFLSYKMVISPIVIFISAQAGIIMCIIKHNSYTAAIAPIICGISGIIGYATNPLLVLGNNPQSHLILCICILAFGSILLILRLLSKFIDL